MILFYDHHAMRFRDRIKDRFLVQRLDRPKIDDLGGDVFLLELSRDFKSERNRLRITNNRHVAAFPLHFRFAERNEQLFVRRLDHSLRAVEQFRFQNEHWIVITHSCFEQPFCVTRRGRRANFQAGHAGIEVFGRVRVRCTELMRRSIGTAESDRDIKLPPRHCEHVRRVIHDLIESYERKAERHKLDNRPQADHRRTNTQARKSVLADGGVDDAPRSEALKQALTYLVGAVIFSDFLAHQKNVWIALQLFSQRFVECLAISNFSHGFAPSA